MRPKSINERAAQTEGETQLCCIVGCCNPTMRAAGVGVSSKHCRQHVEHNARHGSHWHGTYSAAELKPYIAAASSYVRPRAETDRFIVASIAAIAEALEDAGPVEIATRLKGMSAAKRSKIALARLRVAGIKPERIVAIALAVVALVEEDAGSHRTKEFLTVQIAKAVHRLASGTHRVWQFEDHQGRTRKAELHAFPKSSGPVLRSIGKAVVRASAPAIEKHLAGVMALKAKRYGRHPSIAG